MKVRIPTARKNGRSGEIHGASARRPLPLGADAEVFPPAEVRDLRGRPLPVVYMPLLGFLVMIAAVYGLVVNDAYRLVSFLTRETWRAQDAVTLATVPVLLWATWLSKPCHKVRREMPRPASTQPQPEVSTRTDSPRYAAYRMRKNIYRAA